MLAKSAVDGVKLPKAMLDMQMLRLGIIAELDATNLYEQMAVLTTDRKMKACFMDIAKEEKTHVGEFLALLLMKDKEQVRELEKGKEEIDEM